MPAGVVSVTQTHPMPEQIQRRGVQIGEPCILNALMHYHLIGICGTAMASLAGMLQARGHQVTGSDENVYPPMCTMLNSLGIEISTGYEASHLTPAPDCVVVGNAIPRGNPEVEETLNHRLLYRSLPEVIKEEF